MNGIKAATLTRVKADVEDGLAHGEAMAMVSLYGIRDHDGDRVAKGAFDAFAEGFNAGEYTVPVVWQHGRALDDHIGQVLELDPHAVDDQGREGLGVKLRFEVDNPIPKFRDNARYAHQMVKGRRVGQWSYAWDGDSAKLKDGSNELTNMKLAEVSPVLRGALSETHTVAVKAEDEPMPADAPDVEPDALARLGEALTAAEVDLADWLAAKGGDLAGLVSAIVAHLEQPAPEPATDTPPFKGRDPVALAAKAELELPDLRATG